MSLSSFEKRQNLPREGLSDDGSRDVLSFRGKLRAIRDPIQERPEQNTNMPRKWADVAKLLFLHNPEYAQICLDELNKIDINASIEEKIDHIMLILAHYSPDTEAHCSNIKRMIEREGGLADKSGYEAFSGINFSVLAAAAEFHDIGKVVMPKSILDPASGMRYGQQEKRIKETHPVLGYMILNKLGLDIYTQRLALTHHLRYKTDETTGAVTLSGYPRQEFINFCKKTNQPVQLTQTDHLVAFTDVYTALTDQGHRRSNVHDINFKQDEMDICMEALEKMSKNRAPDLFADAYYQQGEGKALFDAFKAAMIEITKQGGLSKAA